jgi:putative restriction endonuclease
MAFGEIPGQPAGTTYADYAAMVAVGMHRQHNVGMVGGAKNGTESIVLNGGYVDDQDYGDEIIYTGFGGRDGSGRQVKNQEWIGANEGMRVNIAEGLPVRVIRGPRGEPALSPTSEYRYDGLYTVERAWEHTGVDGFRVCQFALVKVTDEAVPVRAEMPAPPMKSVMSVVTRRIRDTAMARRVKEMYDHTCQFCGVRLVLPDGRAYAEGAHIRPLGKPHDGPDTEDNVLCLCPNDHFLFDHGARYLTDALEVMDCLNGPVGKITVASGHAIDLGVVGYHRSLFGL